MLKNITSLPHLEQEQLREVTVGNEGIEIACLVVWGGLALVSLVGFGYSGFGSLFLQICHHSSIQFKNNCMLLDKVTLNDVLKCVYR